MASGTCPSLRRSPKASDPSDGTFLVPGARCAELTGFACQATDISAKSRGVSTGFLGAPRPLRSANRLCRRAFLAPRAQAAYGGSLFAVRQWIFARSCARGCCEMSFGHTMHGLRRWISARSCAKDPCEIQSIPRNSIVPARSCAKVATKHLTSIRC
jgi:hypothetical protein